MPVVDSDADLVKVLSHSRTVAIYGISDDAASDPVKIAGFLAEHQHTLHFVNPHQAGKTVLKRKIHASFWGIPRGVKVDLVVLCPTTAPVDEATMDAAITRYARHLWVEPGVLNLNVVGYAATWFENVVLNRPLIQEYDRLLKGETPKELIAPALPSWWEARHRLRRIPAGLE